MNAVYENDLPGCRARFFGSRFRAAGLVMFVFGVTIVRSCEAGWLRRRILLQ